MRSNKQTCNEIACTAQYCVRSLLVEYVCVSECVKSRLDGGMVEILVDVCTG